MADPHIPNGIRAQVVLQDVSNLPRDRYVTTWAFEGTTAAIPTIAELDQVGDALEAFWLSSPGVGLDPVAHWLSSSVSRAPLATQIKLYRLNDTPPRTPRVRTITLPPVASGDQGLPTEVAICLSFSTNSIGGPRGRGRVFIGPIHSNAGGMSSGRFTISGAPRVGIAAAAQTLTTAPGPKWSILSIVNHTLYHVDKGFVDNEFDTQRSRGKRATDRLLWP